MNTYQHYSPTRGYYFSASPTQAGQSCYSTGTSKTPTNTPAPDNTSQSDFVNTAVAAIVSAG